MLLEYFKEQKVEKFVIFGAQVIAFGAYKAIKELLERTPECFVVSTMDGNPNEIDGIQVQVLDNISKDMFIIVGVTELVQKEVLPDLKQRGYHNLFILTQHEEHLLMSEYYKKLNLFSVIMDNMVCEETSQEIEKDFVLYEVQSHVDKPLVSPPSLMPFEVSIQAGADIAKKQRTVLLDNEGENISNKNKQYCEMTATYWVWKNTKHKWTGIEHYRRHLFVKPWMLKDNVDAILPLPYLCYPNELEQFRRFVSEDVVIALKKALQVLHPEEYVSYLNILNGPYQYTYNLVCARRNVFDDYCTWVFEIMEYMETMGDKVPVLIETRALSYVAEVLTNLYFMTHKEWNILHVEKGIYV